MLKKSWSENGQQFSYFIRLCLGNAEEKFLYIRLLKKFFVGAGCGVWGVVFYRFSGYSAKLSRAVVNYLIFREKVPKITPRSLQALALFDLKKA
ncbi:MAG: hypothetical protein ACKO8M_00450, partial [Microcystis panniformis]